jgi:hypothetical protein
MINTRTWFSYFRRSQNTRTRRSLNKHIFRCLYVVVVQQSWFSRLTILTLVGVISLNGFPENKQSVVSKISALDTYPRPWCLNLLYSNLRYPKPYTRPFFYPWIVWTGILKFSSSCAKSRGNFRHTNYILDANRLMSFHKHINFVVRNRLNPELHNNLFFNGLYRIVGCI